MSTKLKIMLLSGALILGVVVGSLAFFPGSRQAMDRSNTVGAVAGFQGSYEELTRDEMIAQADAIFIGDVVSISPAQWNQDSGEYWQNDYFTAIPFHQLEVAVVRPFVDRIGLGPEMTITVLGGSPSGSIQSGEFAIANEPEHTLQVRHRALFFVVRRELAWRSSVDNQQATRPIIHLMGAPSLSYLTAKSNGLYHSEDPAEQPLSLSDLTARILKVRPDDAVSGP
jgi:hypothetical protein